MEASPPPRPAADLSTRLYYQLVYTLTDLLPPPLDNSPEALHARNQTAIASAAALLPVNTTEVDLAARCIAARAQAEDALRLLRQHAGDINLVLRLNAQYGSMVRTSLAMHGRLMQAQALRQKQQVIEAAATKHASTDHAAEHSTLKVANPDAQPQQAASPAAVAPVAAPAASEDQKTKKNVSETGPISQDVAFETWLSTKPWNRKPTRSDKPNLNKNVPPATPGSLLIRSLKQKRQSIWRYQDGVTPMRQVARTSQDKTACPFPTLGNRAKEVRPGRCPGPAKGRRPLEPT